MKYHVIYKPGDVTYYTTNYTSAPTYNQVIDHEFMLNQPDSQIVTWELNDLPLTQKFIWNHKRTLQEYGTDLESECNFATDVYSNPIEEPILKSRTQMNLIIDKFNNLEWGWFSIPEIFKLDDVNINVVKIKELNALHDLFEDNLPILLEKNDAGLLPQDVNFTEWYNNFQTIINTCLSTNPEDGLCSGSDYGVMSDWDVSRVTDMSNTFKDKTTFNGDISSWDVSNVTDMSNMFNGAKAFNQNINSWDVSSVTDMSGMFTHTTDIFNQPLGNWDVSNVTDMNNMFSLAYFFNQDISSWDVSNVTNMTNMFRQAIAFNQDISGWNVISLTTTNRMFYNADAFNQEISSWDLSNVTDMQLMFNSADAFNQDVSTWDVSNVTDMSSMFDNSGVSTDNYDNILIGWSSQALQSNVPFGADGLNYCSSEAARQILIDTYGWTITDGGLDCATASIEDQTQLDISIYPNPTNNTLFISGNETPIKVSIYNVLGKEVLSIKNTNNINVAALPSGVYVIKISDGVGQTNRKFIKN